MIISLNGKSVLFVRKRRCSCLLVKLPQKYNFLQKKKKDEFEGSHSVSVLILNTTWCDLGELNILIGHKVNTKTR